jgi:hypothetical protein
MAKIAYQSLQFLGILQKLAKWVCSLGLRQVVCSSRESSGVHVSTDSNLKQNLAYNGRRDEICTSREINQSRRLGGALAAQTAAVLIRDGSINGSCIISDTI